MAYIKQAGVYYLKNTSNGFKVYIGSSVDMRERLTAHFSALKRGDHRCHHLQRIYDKYGEESIELGIVEEYQGVARTDIRKHERYHIDKFLEIFPRDNLLNGTLNTECPLDDPEVSKRQKQAAKDFWNNNPEFREATISRGTTRLKQLNQEESFCSARLKRLNEFSSDVEFQSKRVAALRNKTAKKVVCLSNGIIFDSGGLAAEFVRQNSKFYKASPSAISQCCLGRIKQAYGYEWQFAT